MRELEPLQQGSTAFDEQDPLWAVLTHPGEARYLDELFAAGRREVDEILAALAERGIQLGRTRALDFGCGVGRLTRALAEHFDACDGVDTTASLIEHARELARAGDRVRFHHMTTEDLELFDDASFDFVLAAGALGHMGPAQMRDYLREFMRVLRPGGVAFISLPERVVPARELPREGGQATLTALGSMPRLASGEVFPLRLNVHNDSPIPWASSAQLRVAQRWRGSDGALLATRGSGAVIPETVNPGGDHELQIWVVAPLEPGEYELEADLHQEQFGWFGDRGSRKVKLPVAVVAEGAASANSGPAPGERVIARSEHAGFSAAHQAHAMPSEDVIATVVDVGGVVLELLGNDRAGAATRSVDYVVARAPSPPAARSPGAGQDQQGAIEVRIRRALRYGAGSAALSGQFGAADPRELQRRRLALQLTDERADLVGFALSSSLKSLARVSTLVREGVRRALFEVLFRQSEFNRASGELIRAHEGQLEALGATVRAQLDIQAGADERVEALERRLARVEVNAANPMPGAAGEAARPGPTDPGKPD